MNKVTNLDIAKVELIHIWNKITLRRRKRQKAAKKEFQSVLNSLTADDIVIDLGANIGEFTIQLAATGARVFAFEPDPFAYDLLCSKTDGLKNVITFNAAATCEDGEMKLFRSANFNDSPTRLTKSSSLVASKKNVDETNPLSVTTVNFSRFLKSLNNTVKLVKMDIEGGEVELIEDLFDSGDIDLIENLFVETHERDIPSFIHRTDALKQKSKSCPKSSINWDWH